MAIDRNASHTKAQVLKAAIRLFGRDGFHATSVNDIVKAAGVTKGAFYHHFVSKDEVLRQIHDEFIDNELSRMRAVVARNLSASETLHLLIEEFARCSENYREEIIIFFRERQHVSKKVFAEIARKRDEAEQIFIDTLERGISNGEFRQPKSTRISAFGIIGMGVWMYQWYRPGGPLGFRAVARIYADLVIDGLRPRTGDHTPDVTVTRDAAGSVA